MNLLTISSIDLLRYDGGALGLTKYTNGNTGESAQFFESEDPSLEAGRKAGVFAFVMGLLFLCMLTIHNFFAPIPSSDILLTVLGAVIQLCLLVIYIAKDNGICEIEGCTWGNGATWLSMSQILMLSASTGSIYTSGLSSVGGCNKVRRKEIKLDF